jgi:hypothetical protein
MKHESGMENITITESVEESFGFWLNKPYISDELRSVLSSANVLIVPYEGFRELDTRVFPVGTEEIFSELKSHVDNGVVPEICIEDKDYRELALHSDLLIIGTFIVTTFAAPTFVNIVSEWVNNRLGFKKESTNVKIELTVAKSDGTAGRILYEGPAKEFATTVGEAIQTFNVTPSPRVTESTRTEE